MMFEKLSALADRLEKIRDQVLTEEAAKTALVLPFIRELGYDVFNPTEVIPEFTADVGIKKGEKVDYAVCLNGAPIMLIECKPAGAKLNSYSSQLYRYFSVTKARIAILTDGIEYRFFSDLAEPNKLDQDAFFTFNLDSLREEHVERLEQFAKNHFDLEKILTSAESLRYKAAIRAHFGRELAEPSDAFVRHFAEALHSGRMTQSVLDRFRVLVKTSINEYVSNAVDHRLRAALDTNRAAASMPADSTLAEATEADEANESEKDNDLVTTMEELHGFYLVKAILRDQVEPSRVVARDVRSYFGILLDDNNRKPICRLWFNRSRKYLGVFDEAKIERRIPISSVDDLFVHASEIRSSLACVLKDSSA